MVPPRRTISSRQHLCQFRAEEAVPAVLPHLRVALGALCVRRRPAVQVLLQVREEVSTRRGPMTVALDDRSIACADLFILTVARANVNDRDASAG